MHRLRYIRSGFVEALSIRSNIPVMEPYDKADIKPGIAYLAPANYHMYVESPNHIALSTEEAVNHSRPSIDLTYVSAAEAYRNKLIGIVLSGANRDGAIGMKRIAELGGVTIVQDPNECKARTMPEATLSVTPVTHVYGTEQMIQFLKNI